MSYQEAFEALKNRDFKAAVPLLETAARETGFSSDIINNAYTLALHRVGDNTRLAEVAFRVGMMLVKDDPGGAMDYFQRALLAGLDSARVRRIGEVHEEWAAPPTNGGLRLPVKRVAHVLGCVLSGHAPTQYVKMLCSSLAEVGIESSVFTTEWAASWFFNPTGVAQSQDRGIPRTTIASVEGDFMERAGKVADAVRASGAQVAFYHASLSEQITARVAALRPAAVQVNVNHGGEMDVDLFHGRIHLFRNALERTRFGARPTEWIPLASDIEERLKVDAGVTRQSLGIESASSVSATFGNLYKVAGAGYLRALTALLKRFPQHFHLFAGAGDVKVIRAALHADGVLPRVRFLGHMGEVAPLLSAVDVYLASFPHSGGHSILEAMGAGKPVVVLRYPSDSHYNSGAELVGIPELIAPGEADYVEIADRLIRNATLRAKYSGIVRDRFRAEFRPSNLGARYREFLAKVLTAGAGAVSRKST